MRPSSAQSIPPIIGAPASSASKRKRSATVSALIVEIANQHPQLRFKRVEVKRLFTTLEICAEKIVLPKTLPKPLGDELLTAARKIKGSATLSVVFMTDDALAQLHADFLDDPTPTDVITFEGAPELGTAGEICVSADRAAIFSAEHDRDFSEELTLYLVHGWLHLAGYDDLKPALKRQMRAAEARAMRCLAEENALPCFSLHAHR